MQSYLLNSEEGKEMKKTILSGKGSGKRVSSLICQPVCEIPDHTAGKSGQSLLPSISHLPSCHELTFLAETEKAMQVSVS